ncbi:M14 family zinc carboxypeptidase [Winogradskyella jejuensis]|uniref:Fibronectin type III domain-containing protein n=1 Tax=Winogradskyella jejuensis TaxID=1089305 RepID=A0A1M5VV55_9FLAO|nr:M14 family zinc carboxypeptidase [Winogradskyella jejuensis]SHH79142.1 Fibronectin type III domain-containing protein [Winogradskyella jejuensis]
MKRITLAILLAFFALAQTANSQDLHKRVIINSASQTTINTLLEQGVDLRCGAVFYENSIQVEIPESILGRLKQKGISYNVVIEDMTKFYDERITANIGQAQRELRDEHNKTISRRNSEASTNNSRSVVSTAIDSYLQYEECDEVDWATPVNFNLNPNPAPNSFGGCLTLSQVEAELDQMRALYPNLVSVKMDVSPSGETTRGNTYGNASQQFGGQTVYYVRISDNPDMDEPNEPEILYTSMIHSREIASLMSNLFYMWYLLENYDTDSAIKELVDNNEMYFIPVVNPDGLRWNEIIAPNGGGLQRKNLRTSSEDNTSTNSSNNARGVDLNRNFDYFWGADGDPSGSSDDQVGFSSGTYRGPSPFSEPESRILRDFVLAKDFETALMHHTFANGIPHPYGGIPTAVSGREDEMHKWHEDMTKYNRYVSGATIFTPANGIADDWMLGGAPDGGNSTSNARNDHPDHTSGPYIGPSIGSGKNILATTPEHGNESGPTGSGFWPNPTSLVPIAKRAMRINLMNAYHGGRYARLHDLTKSSINTTTSNLDFGIERLGQTHDNVVNETGDFTLTFTPISSNIVSIISPSTVTLDILEQQNISASMVLDGGIQANDKIEYRVQLSNGIGQIIYDVIFEKFYQPNILFSDSGNNLTNWSLTGGQWTTSTSNPYDGASSIKAGTNNEATSQFYSNNINSTLTLNSGSTYDITGAGRTYIEFFTRWDLERNWDFVEIQGRANGSSSWTTLCGKYNKPESQTNTNNAHGDKDSYGFQSSNSGGLVYDGDQMNKWVLEQIIIDPEHNSFLVDATDLQIRFRFRTDDDNLARENYSTDYSGFFIDNFSITRVNIPCDDSNPPTNLAVSNIGLTTADLSWDAIPSATYDIRYRETGTTTWTTVTDISGNTQSISSLDFNTEYEVQVATRCNTTTSAFSVSEIFTTLDPCANNITTYPYTEDFETGEGLWEQPTNDDGIWTRDANGTGSGGTGPNGGFNPGNPTGQASNNFYMYVEGSLNQNPGPGSIVFFESPCIDLTGRENGSFSFRYHMHGSDMGTLEVEASTDFGTTWTSIDTLNGQQQANQTDPWLERNVSLSAYDNQIIKLRFKGTTPPDTSGGVPQNAPFRTDMAIDYINITSDVAASGPTIITQNISVNLDAAGNATIAEDAVNNGSTGTGTLTFDTDITSFTCANLGANTVTLTVTDDNGSDTGTATVTVVDNLAPVPDAASLPDATGECSATITGSAPTATDNCGGTITGTTTDSLTSSTQGTTTVTWTFDDGNGNTSTQTQNIVVNDNTAPVPDAASLPDATGECSATITGSAPTATDNCGGTITGTTTDSLTSSTQGTTTVTWIFDDGNGNTSTQTQNIVVNDNTAPVPDAASLPDATGECSATITGSAPTATDNCGGTITGTTTDSLTSSTQGTTTVTWTFDDGNGNTSTQTQNIVVNDNINPVCVTQDITTQLDGTGNATITANDIDNGSSDNCGVASISLSQTSFTSADIGDNVVTFTVTDVNGNSSMCNATVTVEDSTLDIDDDKFEIFSITPNPFKDSLTIKVPTKLSGDTFNIIIYDLNGRRVFNEVKSVTNNTINLNGLSQLEIAPYIIRMINTTSNSVYSTRLIKY